MKQTSLALAALVLAACDDAPPPESGAASVGTTPSASEAPLLSETPTAARAADGRYIAWREHRIDDELLTGVPLRGSDGLVMADLDADGYQDIVSVHESDDVYDGVPEGHIRIAFGTADPDRWINVTLAEGPEAGAAEDAAIADFNGDGWLDIVAGGGFQRRRCPRDRDAEQGCPGPDARRAGAKGDQRVRNPGRGSPR